MLPIHEFLLHNTGEIIFNENVCWNFEEIKNNFKYDKVKFSIASQNLAFYLHGSQVNQIPFIYNYGWCYSKIPSVEEYIDLFLNAGLDPLDRSKWDPSYFLHKYNDNEIFAARAYQFHTGFLRETDVAIKLKKILPEATIVKDVYLDLTSNIDLICKTENKSLCITVKHEGGNSNHYDVIRKNKKKSDYHVKLVAPRNGKEGLDTVDMHDIEKALENT